jgi:hypothetical protein
MFSRRAFVYAALLLTCSRVGLAAEPHLTAQELEAMGASEMASGELLQTYEVTCLPFRNDPGCTEPRPIYGRFKRLKIGGAEFVCISFHHWECDEVK